MRVVFWDERATEVLICLLTLGSVHLMTLIRLALLSSLMEVAPREI
jgi:hypothetical protein